MPVMILDDRIAVIADPFESMTASGLHVPEGGQQNEPRWGTVAMVGTGALNPYTNTRTEIELAVGNRVFFNRYAGQPVLVDGTEYLFLSPHEIIGIETTE